VRQSEGVFDLKGKTYSLTPCTKNIHEGALANPVNKNLLKKINKKV